MPAESHQSFDGGEIARLRATKVRLERLLVAVNAALADLEATPPDPETHSAEDMSVFSPGSLKPEGGFVGEPRNLRDAVVRVLSARPGEVWKVSQIYQVLSERGWIACERPAYRNLQNTCARLAKTREIRRIRNGHYAFVADGFEQTLSNLALVVAG